MGLDYGWIMKEILFSTLISEDFGKLLLLVVCLSFGVFFVSLFTWHARYMAYGVFFVLADLFYSFLLGPDG